MNAPRFASDAEKWAAVRARDTTADGAFFYSVDSTRVFCYPSCAARPARRENVRFHASVRAAERAGFRACKRCRPDLAPRAEREAALVVAACRRIENAVSAPTLAALAAAAGLSPFHFHRIFKRVTGVTPKAYADAHRQRRVDAGLRGGNAVTTALYDAGFNSAGRFYAAAPAMLGMTPTRYRAGGAGETIPYAFGRSSLGKVLVATTERGVCAILLGDDEAGLRAELQARFPKARLESAGRTLAARVAEVVRLVDSPTSAQAVPLDIRGTAFQRKVWEELRRIAPGETTTYGEIARRIGQPSAARAVGAAIGANAHAVLIPCHRVLPADGSLGGYRWGPKRKRKLLEREDA